MNDKKLEQRLNSIFWDAVRRILIKPSGGRPEWAVIARAQDMVQSGAYSEARALLQEEKFIKFDPTALQVLALALIGLNEQEQALQMLATAAEYLKKQLSVAYVNISLASFEAGDQEGALVAARQAREYNPLWSGPWVNLFMVYCGAKSQEAIESEVARMEQEWPGWRDDADLQERIQVDVTLRFIRDTRALRSLFP